MRSTTDGWQQALGEPKCQGCGDGGMERVLDLGYQPLCNEFLPISERTHPHVFYPLCLCHCRRCFLVQLNYIIPTAQTFGDQYTYLTGSSKSLINYYSALASTLAAKFGLQLGDVVVEIGSNDGTFLKAFQSLGMGVIGIEGARRSAAVALEGGIPTLVQFFGRGTAGAVREHLAGAGNIRLITAMNVLAHTDNINDFLDEVTLLMGPDTVFVSQSHWLGALVQKFEFDTIYHEHLRYYTLGSLMQLFDRHGLHIEDAEITDFYGGSILVRATKGAARQSAGVASILRQEEKLNVIQSLKTMKQQLMRNKAQLLSLLVDLKISGKRTVGIGAPMKASTLLNFYGITSDLVEYLAEVNQLKVGTMVPGVGIPVVDEGIVFEEQPDYAMLLSWNMASDLIPKYRSLGYRGKFILPVPQLEVID